MLESLRGNLVYKSLFEPITIRNLHLKNRIMMASLITNFAVKDDVSKRLKAWYIDRATGGAGMIISQKALVHPETMGKTKAFDLSKDECVPRLKVLSDAIHARGAKIAVQIDHSGRKTSPENISAYPVSASSIAATIVGRWSIPRTLTIDEIKDRQEAFAEGARRAQEAGFDAVQIQAAHGYLIWSFLSPLANKRRDKYGADLEGRVRFLTETLKLVRKKVGDDFPILVRMNGSDYVEGGITLNDAKFYAQRLEENGADVLCISGAETSRLISGEYMIPPRAFDRGCNAQLSAEIKKAVNIPISVAGRIDNPDLAEKILQEGKSDLIEMGRALIADPELPKKAAERRSDEIRLCIACNRCEDIQETGLPLECTVNAFAGNEYRYKITHCKEPKNVLVVGGGPAGMEAARVASLRGHNVVLREKDRELGGQLRLAAVPPYKAEMRELVRWFETSLKKLGVKVELGQEVTASSIEEMEPDAVIIATGALSFVPTPLIVNLENVVTANDVLAGEVRVGETVVVVGGGLVGCETADLLSDRGKKVVVVEMLRDLGMLLDKVKGMNEMLLLRRLCEKGVQIIINAKVERIIRSGVIVTHKGTKKTIEADTIVLATGVRENKELNEKLRTKTPTYQIGDCKKTRKLINAIQEGFIVARKI